MSATTRILFACETLLLVGFTARAGGDEIIFGRDIRPILSDRCFACHGPDEAQRQADLRLDLREAVVAAEAIVPGQPDASSLLERVASSDPDVQMPPPDGHKKPLTPAEVDLFRRWIAAGAPYAEHWAYAPPVRSEPPPSSDPRWASLPIDRFIAAGRQQHELAPAPPADRRTLIRRLTVDLLGLPPTAAEVDAFVNDPSPDAYERLVDRLLKSPHFGERMAVYWLDLVRFADTCGYHSDNHRDVSAYRDYVIDSFNDNKRFDQFTREQLAGDLLPESTLEQKVGSGYNRLLQTTEEGGAQAREYIAIYQADRVRNVSGVWLGVTLGCSQCHDHKFDPFTSRDFYSMAAFFADLKETVPGRQPANLRLPTDEETAEIALRQLEVEALAATAIDSADLARWNSELAAALATSRANWTPVKPLTTTSAGGATLMIQDDLSVLASGANPAKDDYTVTLPSSDKPVTGLRLEALTHPSLAGGGLSRANGNFVLTDVDVELLASDGAVQPVKIAAAAADYAQPDFPITNAIDDNAESGWAVSGWERKLPCTAVFTFAEPVAVTGDAQLVVRMKHQSPHGRHNIGRFRWSQSTVAAPQLSPAADIPIEVASALETAPDQRNEAQQQSLIKYYREKSPALAAQREQMAAARKRIEELQSGVQTMLVSEAGPPRMVRILHRGNWLDESGEVVEPNTPAALPPLGVEGRRATRLDLANWIVSPENPLTARVMVNRLWYLMFGNGLSRSLEDVGLQGQWPTHPELLDWLAIEFVESGWDVKHLLKTIALSQTYQQSSVAPPEVIEMDPYNQWLARQNRFRRAAEFIRDNALAVSGLLIQDVGSRRSVRPYQPAGFWRHLNFPVREYEVDSGTNLYRRSLYTYWCRTFPHPSLTTFDAPGREECTAKRARSNTPLQALVLLNDPIYVEASRAFAQRILAAQSDPESRISWGVNELLGRAPTDEERAILLRVQQAEADRYSTDPVTAEQSLKVGQSPVPPGTDAVELATWTSVARVLLNLHETITRY